MIYTEKYARRYKAQEASDAKAKTFAIFPADRMVIPPAWVLKTKAYQKDVAAGIIIEAEKKVITPGADLAAAEAEKKAAEEKAKTEAEAAKAEAEKKAKAEKEALEEKAKAEAEAAKAEAEKKAKAEAKKKNKENS